ncbi:MAG: hypothetical protein ACRDJW_01255 [Thermomicrobiales bacterium]
MNQTAKISNLPVAIQASELEVIEAPNGSVPALASSRMKQLIPKGVTRREKQVGKEIAYRVAVQRGHELLGRQAAEAIGRAHDHTHQCLVAGVLSMNARVRSITNPDDQVEIAEMTAEQKAMYRRHQLGNLEATCYRIAKEVDRELYVERVGGLRSLVLGD